MSNEKIVIEFDPTIYPQFIEAFKARYSVDTEEEALDRLKKEITQLYAYGRTTLLISSIEKQESEKQ